MPKAGERILDIGCGCGVDTLLAAMRITEGGSAVGIDISSQMVKKARKFADEAHIKNVTFIEGGMGQWLWPDESFDRILSNGVFNLIQDKESALKKIFSLLKPQGSIVIADQIRIPLGASTMSIDPSSSRYPDSWAL
ncbi:MAG: methyltransferase domain-containing protein [Desulfovibrionaceae bacterium]